MIYLHSIILVASLTTDAFTAGLSYGGSKIKIPNRSLCVISLICSLMLGIPLALGDIFADFIPPEISKLLCFWVLFSLGITRLFDLILKSCIKKRDKLKIRFSCFSLNFILTVYADSKLADADNSKSLSIKESITLATALSLDGVAVGFGAGLFNIGLFEPLITSLVMTFSAVKLGEFIGRKLRKYLFFDLSYLSASLLLVLAFLKL